MHSVIFHGTSNVLIQHHWGKEGYAHVWLLHTIQPNHCDMRRHASRVIRLRNKGFANHQDIDTSFDIARYLQK